MITESIKRLVERTEYAFVASADVSGLPHLAAGRELSVPDPEHLVFRAWFCGTTLHNLERNPYLCVAVVDAASGEGFQFAGRMVKVENSAFLNGMVPEKEPPGTPQAQWSLVVQVEKVMAFSAAVHTDQPIG